MDMARGRPAKTRFIPENPKKYKGNVDLIICRSGWEKAVCAWMDKNPNVLKWTSEELVIPYFYPVDQKTHRYFVDFFVEIRDNRGNIRKLVIEVKPDKETKPPVPKKGKRRSTLINEQLTYAKNEAKWKAARLWAEKNGAEFVIWTEKHLVELGVNIGR